MYKILCVLLLAFMLSCEAAGKSPLNRALSYAFKLSLSSGEYATVSQKWFGTNKGASLPECNEVNAWPTRDAGSDLDVALTNQKIRFGYYATTPFAFKNNSNVVGFDVDITDIFVEKIKSHYAVNVLTSQWIEVTYNDGFFNDLRAGLENNVYDAMFSGITIRTVREETVDFGCPYIPVTVGIVTYSSEYFFQNATQLDETSGVRICYLPGTTWEVEAKKFNATEKTFIEVQSEEEYYYKVGSECDIAFSDDSLIEYAVANTYTNLTKLNFTVGPSDYCGFATREPRKLHPTKQPQFVLISDSGISTNDLTFVYSQLDQSIASDLASVSKSAVLHTSTSTSGKIHAFMVAFNNKTATHHHSGDELAFAIKAGTHFSQYLPTLYSQTEQGGDLDYLEKDTPHGVFIPSNVDVKTNRPALVVFSHMVPYNRIDDNGYTTTGNNNSFTETNDWVFGKIFTGKLNPTTYDQSSFTAGEAQLLHAGDTGVLVGVKAPTTAVDLNVTSDVGLVQVEGSLVISAAGATVTLQAGDTALILAGTSVQVRSDVAANLAIAFSQENGVSFPTESPIAPTANAAKLSAMGGLLILVSMMLFALF